MKERKKPTQSWIEKSKNEIEKEEVLTLHPSPKGYGIN